MSDAAVLRAFAEAAVVPATHRDGDLGRARELLSGHPDLPRAAAWTAALSGDPAALEACLAEDPACATRKDGPRDWAPLLYLTFSRFLRDDPERRPAMRECARRLLDAGADPNAYWIDPPEAEHGRESALYGACGIAHDVPLTKMLLDAGADPNDGESAYHAVEQDGLACALMLFEHGLDADGGATALLHRLDWDDLDGMEKLIDAGADPNHTAPYGKAALHQALLRSRTTAFFERLLARGANPDVRMHGGFSAYALAARFGRTDVTERFERHGADTTLDPVSAFIARCAAGDGAGAKALRDADPGLVARLSHLDRLTIVQVAADGNTRGVEGLLDAGFDIEIVGDWGGTAIHHAAWQGRADTVRLLVARGAQLEKKNGFGGTVLDTAVYAVQNAGFAGRDYPGVIRHLLEGGADPGAVFPRRSVSAEIDALLARYRRT